MWRDIAKLLLFGPREPKPAPLPAGLPAHQVMPARDAVARHGLAALLSDAMRDALAEDEDQETWDGVSGWPHWDNALVFDGDCRFEEEFSVARWAFQSGPSYGPRKVTPSTLGSLVLDNRLIVIKGDLAASRLALSCVDIFVLGNLACDVLHLEPSGYLYVAGNVVAGEKIAAVAEDDEGTPQTDAQRMVRIDGVVSAPLVETWHMRLGHLTWAAGCGTETILDGR